MLINRFKSAYLIAAIITALVTASSLNPAYSQMKTSARKTTPGNRLPKGFTGHFIEANGAKIYYRTGGNGPVLVLLHGFPEDGSAFNQLIVLAASHYNLVVPDLRGIGLSKATGNYDAPNIARDVYAILKSEKINHVYIL